MKAYDINENRASATLIRRETRFVSPLYRHTVPVTVDISQLVLTRPVAADLLAGSRKTIRIRHGGTQTLEVIENTVGIGSATARIPTKLGMVKIDLGYLDQCPLNSPVVIEFVGHRLGIKSVTVEAEEKHTV